MTRAPWPSWEARIRWWITIYNPGSPAEDAGTADGAPDHDFEYDTRPVGAGFDIGADEISAANPVVHSVQVVSGLEVEVRFSQAMGLGVTTPSNYTVSGSGKGTLSDNPATVTHQGGSTYRSVLAVGLRVRKWSREATSPLL